MGAPSIHFVTGRLAEHSLRAVLADLSRRVDLAYSVQVMPITVAALMTTEWVARRVRPPESAERVVLPGYCSGELEPVARATGLPVERGPRDVRELPLMFGAAVAAPASELERWDIEILAEINGAPRMPLAEVLCEADALRAEGADVIDVGCLPDGPWRGVGQCVRELVARGHRVSIDSFDPREVEPAIEAGAQLVLSVNNSNLAAALDWPCEVVAVPDDPATLGGLEETVERLTAAGRAPRIDPILEPIGCGFATSLARYAEVRRRWPEHAMLMGVGNLTEMTEVDSAGVNVLLLGICQELGVHSVLTTRVINWARGSVRECDIARRLVRAAVAAGRPAKHLDSRLVSLRDPRLFEAGAEAIERLAREVTDRNFRLFAERGELHLVTAGLNLHDADPFLLWRKLAEASDRPLDADHAFYLGYEMAKAVTALTLGKQYRQDEALDWGWLTRPETSHRGERPAARRPTKRS